MKRNESKSVVAVVAAAVFALLAVGCASVPDELSDAQAFEMPVDRGTGTL